MISCKNINYTSKKICELLVNNSPRRFTAREIADELGVSVQNVSNNLRHNVPSVQKEFHRNPEWRSGGSYEYWVVLD
jgi:predicted transcriptional regulator